MSTRYKGSILSATAATNSQSAAVGIWRPNEVLQAVNASLWPLGITYDPYFKYVTLLLHGDGTNGAQNNTFLDSSTNNFTITRNGNTTQGTFTPYGDNWSNYFNSSYESISGGVTNAGTGDVCAECFVYYTGTYADYNFIFDSRTSAGSFTDGFNIAVNITNGYFYFGQANQDILTSIVCQKNTWYHVCVTRQSGVFRLFINGVLGGTYISLSNLSSTSNRIGWYYGATASYQFPGYISNFRATKSVVPTSYQTSSTTVGATIFTPPTTALTTTSQGASGTSLLTCQSNRFIDNSSNAFAITVNGSPSIQRFSPFSPSAAYSTSVIGGSGYFDGSGDYLALTQASLSTNDYTIECWLYATSNSSNGVVYDGNSADLAGNGAMIVWSSGAIVFRYIGNASPTVTFSTAVINTWYHVAISKSGTGTNNVSCYVNGTRVGQMTYTTSMSSTSGSLGTYATRNNFYFPGYITDFRILNGTALYSGTTITVPTAPLTAVTNTSLLLNYTNAGIYDNAMMNDLETVGSAQVSTSVVKFGTGSVYFNGSSYLNEPSSQNFAMGSGDFTWEAWVYFPSGSTYRQIFSTRASPGTASTTAGSLGINTTNGLTWFTNTTIIGYATSIGVNQWVHVAICRASGTIRMFVAGTQVGSAANTDNLTASTLTVGSNNDGSEAFNGYIDDMRITKGYARYTSTFTPPAAAFPNQ